MAPNSEELTTAYSMCICNGECSRSCTVCQSPTWQAEDECVKVLWAKHFQPRYATLMSDENTPASRPVPVNPDGTAVFKPGDMVPLAHLVTQHKQIGIVPGALPSYQRPATTREEAIERFIDQTEEQFGALQPWQARLLREILKGDGDGAVPQQHSS